MCDKAVGDVPPDPGENKGDVCLDNTAKVAMRFYPTVLTRLCAAFYFLDFLKIACNEKERPNKITKNTTTTRTFF